MDELTSASFNLTEVANEHLKKFSGLRVESVSIKGRDLNPRLFVIVFENGITLTIAAFDERANSVILEIELTHPPATQS